MKKWNLFFSLLVLSFSAKAQVNLVVTNKSDLNRPFEVITVPMRNVSASLRNSGNIAVREKNGNEYLVSQSVDQDGNGQPDELLFLANIGPKEQKAFVIEAKAANRGTSNLNGIKTFSRFVPERAKDYAWENDKVAFRIYGSQTSMGSGGGVDAFLKRVTYPIIDKWYQNNAQKEGAYHIDTGEGYDPYQVGRSRGQGGSGVWLNDSLYVSANFTNSKTIAAGPLRTIFELTYETWNAGGILVNEVKRISLDLGSNLSKHEVIYNGNAVANITAGITLHDKKGQVSINASEGWFSYWEPIDDSFLGNGIVMHPASIITSRDYRTEKRDQSHLLVTGKPQDNKLVYYTGYGWSKSGQFSSAEAWNKYLREFALKVASPLEISY